MADLADDGTLPLAQRLVAEAPTRRLERLGRVYLALPMDRAAKILGLEGGPEAVAELVERMARGGSKSVAKIDERAGVLVFQQPDGGGTEGDLVAHPQLSTRIHELLARAQHVASRLQARADVAEASAPGAAVVGSIVAE